MVPNVRFSHNGSGNYIIIDGSIKGHITQGPECYISVVIGNKPWNESTRAERHTIASFKVNHPVKRSKDWCKVVFTVLTVAEVYELILSHVTPYNLQKHIEEGRIPG